MEIPFQVQNARYIDEVPSLRQLPQKKLLQTPMRSRQSDEKEETRNIDIRTRKGVERGSVCCAPLSLSFFFPLSFCGATPL